MVADIEDVCFRFLTIFILMICTGVCAYWRSRYRTRFVSTRSLIWSALDPYYLSSNFRNFSTSTTLEPRIIQNVPPITWQRHGDFLTSLRSSRIPHRNPMTSGLIQSNSRLTLQPTLVSGIVERTHTSMVHHSVTVRGIEGESFVSHPPSYSEAITLRNGQGICLPPPYGLETSNCSVHANENFSTNDSPPPYNSLSVNIQ